MIHFLGLELFEVEEHDVLFVLDVGIYHDLLCVRLGECSKQSLFSLKFTVGLPLFRALSEKRIPFYKRFVFRPLGGTRMTLSQGAHKN